MVTLWYVPHTLIEVVIESEPKRFEAVHTTLKAMVSSSNRNINRELFSNTLEVGLLSRVSMPPFLIVLVAVTLNCGGGNGAFARGQVICAPYCKVSISSKQ